MELIFITLISSLFLSLEFLPYFYALTITPKGFVFLGVTHYAYDYFYYLSHMAQGASHLFFSTNLHSGEMQVYTYIGWVYVLWGKLFSIFGIFQTVGYQLASFFMMLLFLFILYKFLQSVFLDSWTKRVGAFFLFLFSNALITFQNGHLTFFDTWSNIGTPFIRLEMVPHHLLTQTLLVASLFLVFSRRSKLIAFSCQLLAISFLLSTLQPLQWALMGGSIGIISFLLKPSLKSLLPGILWILAGLPSVLTFRALFQTQPYVNTMTWEAAQQQVYSLIDFFTYNGIVAILGSIGLPFILRKHTKPLTLLLFYSFLSITLFFSPLPQYFSLLNIRFLSSLPTLLFAVSTVELFSFQLSAFSRKIKINSSLLVIVYWILGIGSIAFLAPPLFFQMKQRLDYDVNNAYFYVSKGAYDALVYAPKVSTIDDVFLVQWPFSAPFTGLSGRREYDSNFLATINIKVKEPKARAFFEGKMREEEMRSFLKENRITRIITYPWTFQTPLSFMKELYKTEILAIYSVTI
ncbi:hypothetical protein HY947_01845 [Candidatus Gottesmanbacteria bacterium]|nr:hypothetical protein [Candidatus Gottesmanbacteria bacterium]